MMKYRRWFETLVALDMLVGTLVGGWADESMSAYAYRRKLAGEHGGRTWVLIIDWAFAQIGEVDHCRLAYDNDGLRRRVPPAARMKN